MQQVDQHEYEGHICSACGANAQNDHRLPCEDMLLSVHLLLKCSVLKMWNLCHIVTVSYILSQRLDRRKFHTREAADDKLSIFPPSTLVFKLMDCPWWDPPPPTLTPTRLYSPLSPWRKTCPLISVLWWPPWAPVVDGGLPSIVPASSGVKGPPAWLSSQPTHPPTPNWPSRSRWQ